jgi:hypothetical protein
VSFRANLRRVLVAVVVAVGGTAAGSALLGLLVGASLQRALSLGFYGVGCLVVLVGFGLGTQNPFRELAHKRDPSHRRETQLVAAALIVAGIALIAIGVGVDSRVHVT